MRCFDTYAILQNGKAFAIEHFLRDLAMLDDIYVFSLLDCPRTKLEYKIEDSYYTKTEGIRNMILMFGCKQLQDINSPSFWALFNLLKRKRINKNMKSILLPDALLYLDIEDIALKDQFNNQSSGDKE